MINEKYEILKNLGEESIMRTESLTTNYKDIGFDVSDKENLIDIALDDDLSYYNSKDKNHMFAPCHAFMALGQLGIEDAFEKALLQIDKEIFKEDDFYRWAIHYYIARVGKNKIKVLLNYFLDSSHNMYDRMMMLEIVEDIVKLNDDVSTEEIENIIVNFLNDKDEKNDALNAHAISVLIDLTYDKYIDLIREVFHTKPIDIFFNGDLEDVEIKLGLRKKRETRRPRIFDFGFDDEDEEEYLFDKNEPFINNSPKIGRNDPCPCGSGKKYKKCCL